MAVDFTVSAHQEVNPSDRQAPVATDSRMSFLLLCPHMFAAAIFLCCLDGCGEIPLPVMQCVYLMETSCPTGHFLSHEL